MSDGYGPQSQMPCAYYDQASSSWKTSQPSLFEDSTPSSVTLPRSGSMRNGRVYERPTSARPTGVNGGSVPRGLPTPLDRDSKGETNRDSLPDRLLKTPTAQLAVNGGSQHPEKRKAGGHGPTLADEVEFLLLPTPRTTDSHGIGHHGRGGQDLRTTIAYLPTPTATDAKGGRNQTANRTKAGHHSGTTLTDVFWAGGIAAARPVQGNRWGDYALAIARWEILMRRDAPNPTEPGAAWHRWRRLVAERRAGLDRRPAGMRGSLTAPDAAHRQVLAVRLVEWMMGLADGWVTGIDMPRNAKLRLLGNGVVPPQAAAAVRYLLNRTEQ